MLFRFDCEVLPGGPLAALLDPTCGSLGLCWEEVILPPAMPFVAGRGADDAVPVDWPDMIADELFTSSRAFYSATCSALSDLQIIVLRIIP